MQKRINMIWLVLTSFGVLSWYYARRMKKMRKLFLAILLDNAVMFALVTIVSFANLAFGFDDIAVAVIWIAVMVSSLPSTVFMIRWAKKYNMQLPTA